MQNHYQSVRSTVTLEIVYCQRRRFFRERCIGTCPRKLFIQHLVQFIATAMTSGYKVILTVDSNEHIVTGKLAKELQKWALLKHTTTNFKLKVRYHTLEVHIRSILFVTPETLSCHPCLSVILTLDWEIIVLIFLASRLKVC